MSVPAAICVVGNKNAGKTTLIERLLPELIARGRRVATIKHDAHDFDIDVPGKDTWRHRQAGSNTTIIASSSKAALVRLTERELGLDELLGLVDPSCDLVLIEGLRRSPLPKILVERSDLNAEAPSLLGEVWAVVTDGDSDVTSSAPRFRPDEPGPLAELIERRLLGGPTQVPAWNLPALLAEAGRLHGHLCPGEVLGVRMAILGCGRLGIFNPKSSRRLIVFVETDRCGADAVQTVTGCTLGRRTLRLVDYGKLAATFLDTKTGRAVRVCARESAREAAFGFETEALDRHEAQLRAYKALPDEELFTVQEVRVALKEEDLPGGPRRHVTCVVCHEEVNDGRQVSKDDRVLCRACAEDRYYTTVEEVEREEARP
jgi:formylmethanofuran dehydrogenase subunit E